MQIFTKLSSSVPIIVSKPSSLGANPSVNNQRLKTFIRKKNTLQGISMYPEPKESSRSGSPIRNNKSLTSFDRSNPFSYLCQLSHP